MKDLSMDLKQRVVELREAGSSAAEVAERLVVGKRSVERLWKHWKEHGDLPRSKRRGKTATRLVGREERLRQWVRQRPDITLEELSGKLAEELGVRACAATIWRALRSMGLRHKKNGVRRRAGPS